MVVLSSIIIEDNSTVAEWEHIKTFYLIDTKKNVRIRPKLTDIIK